MANDTIIETNWREFAKSVRRTTLKYAAGQPNGYIEDYPDPDGGNWVVEPKVGMRDARGNGDVRRLAPENSWIKYTGETPITPHISNSYSKANDFGVKISRRRDRTGD